MTRDKHRAERIVEALGRAALQGLACALPMNVLMLSGYGPVTGASVALADGGGKLILVVPKEEEELARRSGAEVRTYEPMTLQKVEAVSEAMRSALEEAIADLEWDAARIGCEEGEISQPASYVGMHLFGGTLARLLSENGARAMGADGVLEELRRVKTPHEINMIRRACRVAEEAYKLGAGELRVGMSEAEAAGNFRWRLMAGEPHLLDSGRIDGFFYCMSGANGAEARRAHQRSRAKMIQSGDLVVCHCNSYVDGYWTDITRTYCMGSPNDKQRKMYEAVGAVREIVLGAIRPGVRAAEVDHAARQTMGALGFGEAFSTPLGHGVGFGAIDHTARPVLHPASEDVLEEGQVFNVEPGIYLEGEAGKGGMRHCDLVAVTRQGVEQLTPFHTEMREWVR